MMNDTSQLLTRVLSINTWFCLWTEFLEQTRRVHIAVIFINHLLYKQVSALHPVHMFCWNFIIVLCKIFCFNKFTSSLHICLLLLVNVTSQVMYSSKIRDKHQQQQQQKKNLSYSNGLLFFLVIKISTLYIYKMYNCKKNKNICTMLLKYWKGHVSDWV